MKQAKKLTAMLVAAAITIPGILAHAEETTVTSTEGTETSLTEIVTAATETVAATPTEAFTAASTATEVEISTTNFIYLINEGNIMITGYQGKAEGVLTIAPSYLIDGVSYKVTKIGYRAFYKQTDITGVILPEGIVNIGRAAFMNCISLQYVYLPSTVQSIYDYAFRNCILLTDVYYPCTSVEWNAMQMGEHNTLLVDATRTYHAYNIKK